MLTTHQCCHHGSRPQSINCSTCLTLSLPMRVPRISTTDSRMLSWMILMRMTNKIKILNQALLFLAASPTTGTTTPIRRASTGTTRGLRNAMCMTTPSTTLLILTSTARTTIGASESTTQLHALQYRLMDGPKQKQCMALEQGLPRPCTPCGPFKDFGQPLGPPAFGWRSTITHIVTILAHGFSNSISHTLMIKAIHRISIWETGGCKTQDHQIGLETFGKKYFD